MTLPLQVNTGSLIGSEWVSGSSTIDVINPATGGVLATVSNATISDCLAAVDAAERAFESWSKTAPRVRGEILRRAYELMIAEHEALSQLITLEMGKVITDARAEVAYAAEFFRWFSEEAVRIDGVQQVKESKYIMLHAPRSALKAITALLPGTESLKDTLARVLRNDDTSAALRKRDPAVAAAAMEAHLMGVKEMLLKAIAENG